MNGLPNGVHTSLADVIPEEDGAYGAGFRDALESMMLALGGVGVSIETIGRALETSLDAYANNDGELEEGGGDFVKRVASLRKWGEPDADNDGKPYAPSDGMEDSHACLMGLIDIARKIVNEEPSETNSFAHAVGRSTPRPSR